MSLLLTGCTLGGQTSPISILAPSVELEPPVAGQSVEWALQVQRPVADQMRDSDRVLVRRAQSRLQVYPGAAWLDSVPEMLQTMMIRAFVDSGSFEGVGRTGGLRTRYSLDTEIRHFEVVDEEGRLGVDIALQANLVHQRTARVVAGRSFRNQHAVAGSGVDPIAQAFESALGDLIVDVHGWILTEGPRADAERHAEDDDEPLRRWRER